MRNCLCVCPRLSQYYGSFSRSLFTLLQVFTGESWSEAVTRPVIFGYSGWVGALFFVSFVVLHQFVLVQVVVAVLLDKILPSDDAYASQPAAPPPSEPTRMMEEIATSNAMLSDPVELPRPSVSALEPDDSQRVVDDVALVEVLDILREDLREVSEAIQAVCVRKAQLEAIMDQQTPAMIAEKVRNHFKEVKRKQALSANSNGGEVASGWWL